MFEQTAVCSDSCIGVRPLQAAELLLRHGADPGAQDAAGQTPPELAPSTWVEIWTNGCTG
jgi:hypothetical protein